MLRGDSYREVLANRSFRALWLGQTLSHLGQSIIYVVVALYVYELTGSAQQVSFAVALELLPLVVIGPLAGVLADHLERKRMLVAAFSGQAVIVGLLPFTTSLAQVYVLIFLTSLLAPVASLVWAVALPSVTGQELFVRGSSLDIVSYNAANVLGPIAGGWLASLAGSKPVFFLAAGCFVGAASLSMRAAAAPGPRAEIREPLRLHAVREEMVEGIRSLLGSSVLRYLVLLNCISSLGWAAPAVAAVVYVTDTLGLGGREYGLLRGVDAMSIGLGVYVLGRYSRLLSRQRLLVGGVMLAGLVYMSLLVQPGLLLLLGLWFVSGLGWAANWLMDEALWAQLTPDKVRGRVYSFAHAVVSLAEVCMTLLGGWLVTVLGPIQALFIIGLTISTGAIVVTALARPPSHPWPRAGGTVSD
ncbi:MAG: MFS transporter [Anaerolineae bacterium]|nr:MFS transporter [Anaerolineae bacterium]NIN96087.1 MFS transporter [Anaerolineae bacterium]NIQ79117.1 MFS transporter [Anaerolineae bacterium]